MYTVPKHNHTNEMLVNLGTLLFDEILTEFA